MIELSSPFEIDVSLLIMLGGLTRAIHLIPTQGMLVRNVLAQILPTKTSKDRYVKEGIAYNGV